MNSYERVMNRLQGKPVDRAPNFDIDILQTPTDPFRKSVDFGLEVEFPEDGLPRRIRPLLAPGNDLKKVPLIEPGSGRRMSDRIEAVRMLHEQANKIVPVMGWVEGAMAEANDLRPETFGERAGLVGNFDPVSVMYRGSEQTVEEATLHCLAVGGPRSFSAAGCEIPDGTPQQNLRIHARVLREAGSSSIGK